MIKTAVEEANKLRGNCMSRTHPGDEVNGLNQQPDIDGGQQHGRAEDEPGPVDNAVNPQVHPFVLAFGWMLDIGHSAQYYRHHDGEGGAYVERSEQQLPSGVLQFGPERRAEKVVKRERERERERYLEIDDLFREVGVG